MSTENRFNTFLQSLEATDPFLEVWSGLDGFVNDAEREYFHEILLEASALGGKREAQEFNLMMHPDWILSKRGASVSRFMERVAELKDRDLIFCMSSPAASREEALKGIFHFNEDRSVRTETSFDAFSYSRMATGYLSLEALWRFLRITKGFHPDDRYRIHGGEWKLCQTHLALQLSTMGLGKFLPAERSILNVYKDYKTQLAKKLSPELLSARLGLSLDFSGFSRVCEPWTYVTHKFQDERTQVIV